MPCYVAVILSLAYGMGIIGTCVIVVLAASGVIQYIWDYTPHGFGLEKLVGIVLVATVVSIAILVIAALGLVFWDFFGPIVRAIGF